MPDSKKVALIGTGGTIAAVGAGPFDLIDYDDNGHMLDVGELLAVLPALPDGVEVFTVALPPISSTGIYFEHWQKLVELCAELEASHPDLTGIVITHGTASMEETAYFLNLTLKTRVPVVMVGSQRPASALSSDAPLNLYNAIRVATMNEARGAGVLVVLNDEIHSARDVTKTSTYRLQTFRSPDFGVLGHCDADEVAFYRQPVRRHAPNTEFDLAQTRTLPSVGIAYSHTGSDGCVIRALTAAGMPGIVLAAFAPGCYSSAEAAALHDAVAKGVVVVISSRAGSGRVGDGIEIRRAGMIAADNLNPQKARLLLALALTKTSDIDEIRRMFQTY
ncbi:asparaginase [Paraburkholderia azotifigens]|uniref:Asparaginase n=1 Tax=Paraburkholderia azotifigens TaxID=2057004 RepID=A0ABU9R8L9_9BURK